jgi:Putative Flp pilus-assembly TadE/G-like
MELTKGTPTPRSPAPAGRGRCHSRQSGQAIVLIALMLTVLIGMVAIAIDGSRAYTVRRDLQDAVDAASLAAADTMQQTGSYVTAEQNATAMFARNMRLYSAPACSGYGTPGAVAWTVTCTYPDGTVLTDVARALGPLGSRFQLTATRNLQLQFGKLLTNGVNPALGSVAHGSVNNLLYAPTVAALDSAGCGGVSGTAITVNGSGTLSIVGDMVANGTVSVPLGALRVGGDIYSRCQASLPGNVANTCYPSGAVTPCTFPDIAGATRSGNRVTDPGYPAPTGLGTSQGVPSNNVVVPAGIYAVAQSLNSNRCWFLSGGVYTFQNSASNFGDLVSNELKPPDEAVVGSNMVRSPNQFWDTSGVQCDGTFDLARLSGGPRDLTNGQWAFMLTSTRSDTYGGVTYTRESAPSMCQIVNLPNHFDQVQVRVSNVPGATAYNVYAQPPPGNCTGPFGLAASIPVSGTPQNNSLGSCPSLTGGCSLGFEVVQLSVELASPWAPNAAAAAGTTGAYPPDVQTAPLAAGLPNQNPARGSGSSGDRANENDCKSVANAYVTCPSGVTPGAVLLNFPAGSCLTTGNGGNTFVFSGYQYNWISVYEPSSNTCTNTFGASAYSAYVGLVYTPSATASVIDSEAFDAVSGGLIADTVSFTGTLPRMIFNSNFAPVPPAARITS